jgi:hypothetical protein
MLSNLSSNYTQLGLAFTLFSAEVLFNKGNSFIQHSFLFSSNRNSVSGLSLIYLGQVEEGIAELQDAARQKATEEHSVIDEALRDRGEGYTVFSIVRLKQQYSPSSKLTGSAARGCPLPSVGEQTQERQGT